jgi:hypothetical protein
LQLDEMIEPCRACSCADKKVSIDGLAERIAIFEAFVRAADEWVCDYDELGSGTTATALRKARAAIGKVSSK